MTGRVTHGSRTLAPRIHSRIIAGAHTHKHTHTHTCIYTLAYTHKHTPAYAQFHKRLNLHMRPHGVS